MRITKRTNIAIRLLMYCAANPDRLVTKAEIADRCNISPNHLVQVINQLSQLGYRPITGSHCREQNSFRGKGCALQRSDGFSRLAPTNSDA